MTDNRSMILDALFEAEKEFRPFTSIIWKYNFLEGNIFPKYSTVNWTFSVH